MHLPCYNQSMNTNNQTQEKTETERMREHEQMIQRMREQQYWERMNNMSDREWKRMERGE
jgi:hypothetical protein